MGPFLKKKSTGILVDQFDKASSSYRSINQWGQSCVDNETHPMNVNEANPFITKNKPKPVDRWVLSVHACRFLHHAIDGFNCLGRLEGRETEMQLKPQKHVGRHLILDRQDGNGHDRPGEMNHMKLTKGHVIQYFTHCHRSIGIIE